jgi:ArsR family metal-binding transcriptional regulator
MANVVIFPNQTAFELGARLAGIERCGVEAVAPPEFCRGLIPPCIAISGGSQAFQNALRDHRVPIAGMLELKRFTKDIPEGAPPDGRWKEIVGDLLLSRVRPSLTDSLRLRVELISAKDLAPIIPIMARLIRGGAYHPEGPILAFEEEHRLICLSSNRMVFSRVDDLLDMWIMVRCMIDLIIAAWDRRFSLRPETSPRLGIGAIEIYKRLPATNCARCDNPNCMEFAMGLLTGRCKVDQCLPLEEGDPRYRASLLWLMGAIGLTACQDTAEPSAEPVTGFLEAP